MSARVIATMAALLAMAGLQQGAAGQDAPQKLEGLWQGTLQAGTTELRLILHVEKSADGKWKGTMDSVDQGANGIPISSMTLKGTSVNFTVEDVHGSYEGKLNADSTVISGTWSQGQPLALDFKRATGPVKTEHKPAAPSDIDGAWTGTLDAGSTKLRVAFHIANTEDGLTATMDSLDQDLKGMPATAVTREGASLKVEMKQIGGVYEGKVDQDRSTVDGKWTQSGNSLPLVLKRVKE